MLEEWEIEYTDEFGQWFDDLTPEQQLSVSRRVEQLRRDGPHLRRPLIGEIASSRYPNMKELRISKDGALRVLFAFDPRRTAILLIGGDKTGRWDEWYLETVPLADALYETYLQELREEGLL